MDFVKEIQLLHESFVRPKDFDPKKYFKSSFKIWEGEIQKVIIRFDKDVSPLFMRRKRHPNQKMKKQKHVDIILEFELAGTEEIKQWIYTWLPYCGVIEPASLRNQVKEELSHAQKLYEK